jgi:hypothetical protein
VQKKEKAGRESLSRLSESDSLSTLATSSAVDQDSWRHPKEKIEKDQLATDCYRLCPAPGPILPPECLLVDPPLGGALNDLPTEGVLDVLPPDGALNDLPLEGVLNVLLPDGAPNDLPREGVLNFLLPVGGLILFRLKMVLEPFLTPGEMNRPFLGAPIPANVLP